ncbi:hypothetical protein INT45_010597, partial [Circinella minor]
MKPSQDFDFFSNTEKFNSTITEEEAFNVKRHEEQQQHGMNRNNMGSWNTTDRSSGAGTIGSRPSSQDFRNQPNNQFNSSPVRNVQSIWGGFGGGVSSSDRGFGSFGANSGSLSPFMRQQNLQQQQQQQQAPPPPPGLSPSSSIGQQGRGQPVLLEDIEAELQRRSPAQGGYRHDPMQQQQQQQQQQQMLHDEMDVRKNMVSLADIEAAMRAGAPMMPPGSEATIPPGNQLAFQQLQQAYQEHALRAMGFGNKDPVQLLALQQQQQQQQQQELAAADREAKFQQQQQQQQQQQRVHQRKSQYSGLMTQHDKDFINRIQISQLASSDPYSDDFYYQVYSSLRQRAGLPVWSAENAMKNNNNTMNNSNMNHQRGRREENGMQRFHQQLQRV